MSKKKIGLALGGGGARGLAHIGVLKVLEEYKIPISFLSGTSMGGLIAALYASGYRAEELEKEALRITQTRELIKLIDLFPPRRGLLDITKVKTFLLELIGDQKYFSDCQIPLGLSAVDLLTAEEVHLKDGDLIEAILATICVPGVFPPIEKDGKKLVDGGVLNNVPVNILKFFASDFIIAVEVQINPIIYPLWEMIPRKYNWPFTAPKFIQDIYRSELIMMARITEYNFRDCPPHQLICPEVPMDVTTFIGFNRAEEIIQTGVKAAKRNIPEILDMLKIIE